MIIEHSRKQERETIGIFKELNIDNEMSCAGTLHKIKHVAGFQKIEILLQCFY